MILFAEQNVGWAQADSPAFREVDVIFAKHCYKCHGARKQESGIRLDRRHDLLQGGDYGEPILSPGKPSDSRLLPILAGDVDGLRMPPEGPLLTRREISIIRDWIVAGANMPLGGKDVRLDHWAFRTPNRPKIPTLSEPYVSWPTTAIDQFILQRLQEASLSPSDDALRSIWIRRLFLVALGIPPSPNEVARFESDTRPDAYARVVDQVLASPRYGERWGQHWLDLVRFGETHGFETNRERAGAYHYRDYVIRSLNADTPYDRFVLEQIAGDSMDVEAGTGFLVAGPHDLVKSPDKNLTQMQRQDELADIVGVTGTTFLGLTLGCARCHSHKFDPVTQRDYYAIQAVFAGVQHGGRAFVRPPEQQRQLTTARADLARLEAELASHRSQGTPSIVVMDESASTPSTDARGVQWLVDEINQVNLSGGTQRGAIADPGGPGWLPASLNGGSYRWAPSVANLPIVGYQPRINGRAHVWLSWGAGWESHCTSVKYVLDRDGAVETTDDRQTIATVNQQYSARQQGIDRNELGRPPQRALWSGIWDAGIHTFQANTRILVIADGGGAVTFDQVWLLPINNLKSAADRDAREPLPLRNAVRPEGVNVERFPSRTAKYVRFVIEGTSGGKPCIDEIEIWAGSTNAALRANGAIATCSSTLPGYEIHQLEHIHDGRYGNSYSWISDENNGGWIEIELPKTTSIDRIEWARDRTGRFKDRLATAYRIEVSVDGEHYEVVTRGSDRLPYGTQPLARLDFRAPTRKQADALERDIQRLSGLRRQVADSSVQTVAYIGNFNQPGPIHRLHRGDPSMPREEIAPNTVEFLGSLKLEMDAAEKQRRVAFARWVISKENPLTTRVIANRVWQHVFGRGIVDTPSDLGINGVAPTHPALLDWLATELVTHGWSLKHLHREIFLSRTFRQDSRPRTTALRSDSGNQLLWRFSPRRAEAEVIRDMMLTTSDDLNLQAGGPGFSLFEVEAENVRHYFPRLEFGPDSWRRMIYATKVRQERDAVFGLFDCPDASQTVSKRSRSTTPLQALNLFNSKFTMDQSRRLADRAEAATANASDSVSDAVDLLFIWCLGRLPQAAEKTVSVQLVDGEGLEAMARVLLNTNEFLFIP